MDEAFARFQADLAGVGQPMQHMPPPPHAPPPAAAYAPPVHGRYMTPGTSYAAPTQPYYASQPPVHQAPGMPYGTIASIRAGQAMGAGPSSAALDPDHGVPPPPKGHGVPPDKTDKKKGKLREAAGKRWRDPTLDEWPENDFRIFVGDLGNDVNDDALAKAFQKYPSFVKAKIVKDKRTKKTKGFGFVSFLNSDDFAAALREMNGKYVGNRPIKLRKSTWDERNPTFGGGHQNKKPKKG